MKIRRRADSGIQELVIHSTKKIYLAPKANYYTFETKDVKTRKGKIDVLELALQSG